MDPASAEQALAPFEARIAGWLTVGFFLDIAFLGRMDAPVLDALLVAGVMEANLNRLNRDPELQAAHSGLDSAPPDDLRRPVSINALAGSLRLPFETVRRHVNQLVRQGVLVSTPQGVYVPVEVVVSPRFIGIMRARYQRVVQFYGDLELAGAVEPLATPFLPVDHPDAPIRAVGRILSDYFFRTLDALHRRVPDPLTVIVMLEVVRSSTEHFQASQAIAAMRGGWISDAERTPVRVAHLSRRLGIPYETTRRHVGWLVEQGICRRVGNGVLQAAAYRENDTALSAADNLVNIRRLYRLIGALRGGEAEAASAQSARP
ncbi:hypothetical protein LJR219_002343 [Phenylobacterium sp. LjRoot219]|uniref:hypothetical protein n=1 Tax=Phenylobacterium sp. LjRoot219 TaxID=3342283 RepID=UPI003ED07B30